MYQDFVLRFLPRLITQLDRDPDSPNYGCFDRNHWHYKIRDFSSAIVQQAGLCIALAYKYPFEGNHYHSEIKLKQWAIASVEYWSSIQLRDGSFNEYYPFEHSFPSTAFSLFGVTAICRELGYSSPTVDKAMEKSVAYLLATRETEAANQEIAGIGGIFQVAEHMDDEGLRIEAKMLLNQFLADFEPEGWFYEYGGFDLGYLSVVADQLAEIHKLTGELKVMEILKKIIDFSENFISPAGTIGGEYNSRNTQYYFPFHLEYIAPIYPKAGQMAQRIFKHINEKGFFLEGFDDRYLSHYVGYSFIKAQNELEHNSRSFKTWVPVEGDITFPQAGIWIRRKNGLLIIINLKKGGLVKVAGAKGELFNDNGYRIRGIDGSLWVNNWLGEDYQYEMGPTEQIVHGSFIKATFVKANPLNHFALRFLAFLFGVRMIRFLKKRMIFFNEQGLYHFHRRINIDSEKLIIEDHIHSPRQMERLYSADKFSLRHVASSKSFFLGDLIQTEKPLEESNIKEISVQRSFSFNGGQVYTKFEKKV